MKITDFHIGLEFYYGPFKYRCTDVGSRTVTAIKLVEEEEIWLQGPPYMVPEEVLDEHAISEDSFLSRTAAAQSSVDNVQKHPSFPHWFAMKQLKSAKFRYPRPGLLRFERVREDGEILYPWAAIPSGESHKIQIYLPFTEEETEMDEREFLALPIARPDDVRARAER